MLAGNDRESAFYGDGTARPPGERRAAAGFLGRRAVPVALAAGLTLGFRDTLAPEPDDPIVEEVHEAPAPPPTGRIVLYFHPEVPEATLVLVR